MIPTGFADSQKGPLRFSAGLSLAIIATSPRPARHRLEGNADLPGGMRARLALHHDFNVLIELG